jgi:hypothetical protein
MCMMLSKCRKYTQHNFTPLPHLLWNEVLKASNDYLRKEAVLIMSELQLRSSKYEIETIVSSCSGLLYIFRDLQRTDVMNDFAMVD